MVLAIFLLFIAAQIGIFLSTWGVVYMFAFNGIFFTSGFLLGIQGSERFTNFRSARALRLKGKIVSYFLSG
jgi:fucose permease